VGLDDWDSNPGEGNISLFSVTSKPALGLTQIPIQWEQGPHLQEVKRLRREADHSPPYSAKIKNGGAIPPLPHTSSWLGV
jgi:hypothetical protein